MTKIAVNGLYVVIITVFLALLADNGLAQQYPISDSEYYSVSSSAYQKVYEKSRRVDSLDKSFEKGVLVKTDQYIWEYSVPNRKRTYRKLTQNGKTTETEGIEIDNIFYSRNDGGEWTKHPLGGSGSGSGIGSGSVVELTQASKEFVSVKGQSAVLYILFRVEKRPSSLIYYETKLWIGTDDLLIRKEHSSGGLYPKLVNHHSETNYIYDSNLKIEAPIK